jgi:hypothetical protein
MSNLTELFKEFGFDPVMAERIIEKLGSDLSVKLLRQSVVGRSVESATNFFTESLHFQPLDASALAGQLVLTAQAGGGGQGQGELWCGFDMSYVKVCCFVSLHHVFFFL